MARYAVLAVAVAVLVSGGCGGDDEPTGEVAVGEAAVPDDDALEDAADEAGDLVDRAVADTAEDAGVTITLDGETFVFGPPKDVPSFCTTVAGSLQGSMPQLTDTGEVATPGGINFVVFPPDSDYGDTGAAQELLIGLADGREFSSDDGAGLDITVDGRSATGSFTLAGHDAESGPIEASGGIDISC